MTNQDSSVRRVSKEELEAAILDSHSITEVGQKLGFRVHNGICERVTELAKKYDLALPIWLNQTLPAPQRPRKIMSDDEYFRNGHLKSGNWLRERLIKSGRIYTCDNTTCILHGTTEWNGSKLVFQVDHINGDRFDNRKENLRFLCPNCHSQTETFARNNRVVYSYCICGRRMQGETQTFCVHSKDGSIQTYGRAIKKKQCSECQTPIFALASKCNNCTNKQRIAEGISLQNSYPSVEVMIQKIEELGFSQYGLELGVSDNAIRKYLLNRGVNPLPKKLNKKERLGREVLAKISSTNS